jgi:hypothetical protein
MYTLPIDLRLQNFYKISYGAPSPAAAARMSAGREPRFMFDICCRKDGRFILAAGNNITPGVPLESLRALPDEDLYYGIKKTKRSWGT